MNRNISTLIVAAFALALTLSSPAFAQYYTIGGNCPGGVCRAGNQQTAASVAASPCAPCASACGYSCQQTATFAPFGGFFRNLFGGCGDSCAAVRPCARFVERGAQGSACSGGTCFADPVNREFVPGEQTNAVEPCEPVAKTETDAETCEPCDPVECDGETCDECDAEPCEPCDAVQTTEIERRLLNVINNVRERFGRQRCAADRNLFGWARYNSALQARYCRLGHFSGHSYEIAGEGYLTPEACVNGWIGSSAHNAILFGGSWTRVGVSVYQGQNGRYYWTATFGR